MSTSRHHHQAAPAQWAQATWTWSSAVLLSALLVSPVGADALMHLLRLHLPAIVQAAERNEVAAPVQETVLHRKSEEELPAVSTDTQASSDVEPGVTPLGDASLAIPPVVPVYSPTVCATPGFQGQDDRLPFIVVTYRVPRAPPV